MPKIMKLLLSKLLLSYVVLTLSLSTSAQGIKSPETDDLREIRNAFAAPPASARPWVYWFWVNSNVTREGISADLEAMQRVGIGGVLIMDINLSVIQDGTPASHIQFMDSQWKDLFIFAVNEAKRLGMEVIMANDAGWTGSGGPWIRPEDAMQTVVFTET